MVLLILFTFFPSLESLLKSSLEEGLVATLRFQGCLVLRFWLLISGDSATRRAFLMDYSWTFFLVLGL